MSVDSVKDDPLYNPGGKLRLCVSGIGYVNYPIRAKLPDFKFRILALKEELNN